MSKPSQSTKESDQVELTQATYVSRAAYKLKAAIESFNLSFDNLGVADIGASTGGFTQVLLEEGASKVYALDVGRDQLSPLLESDARVENIEGINARYPLPIEQVDAFVCDVSFISLKLIFKNLADALKDGGFGVALVKPQFEAGKGRVNKKGFVTDDVGYQVLSEILSWMQEQGFNIKAHVASPIKGNKSQNQEYLILFVKC